VALDYEVSLLPEPAAPGVRLRVLDGDRSLQARVDPGTKLVVRGFLHEPVLRIGDDGVWVNASSPTAQSDRLVSRGAGWVKVRSSRSFAWHDHRLTPPPLATGAVGRAAIPISVDGQARQVTILFERVARPALWPWLAGAAALVGAIGVATTRPRLRTGLTIGLAVAGGIAAAAGSVAFAARDEPSGNAGWLPIAITLAIGTGFAAVLLTTAGSLRAHAAGIAGAVAAAATLSSLPVFWHGVVVSALPGTLARLACGLALVCGAAAAALSFLPDFDRPRRAAT